MKRPATEMFLVAATTTGAAASLRPPALTGYRLAVYVVAAVEVVGVSESLPLVNLVGAIGYFGRDFALLFLALAV